MHPCNMTAYFITFFFFLIMDMLSFKCLFYTILTLTPLTLKGVKGRGGLVKRKQDGHQSYFKYTLVVMLFFSSYSHYSH